jgi:hypothetical protein
MNRLTRDQVLHRALDMIDAPVLDERDRPGGRGAAIAAGAMSIGWLQDALDYLHRRFPWSGTLTSADLTVGTNGTATLPADFITDVREGVVLTTPTYRRLQRISLQDLLRADPTVTGDLVAYVITGATLRTWRRPTASTAVTLWYYALPAVLDAETVPTFPDDWTLVEYVRLRGREWIGALPDGTAMKYLQDVAARLQASGLGPEAEAATIPLDSSVFRATVRDPHDWMGPTSL